MWLDQSKALCSIPEKSHLPDVQQTWHSTPLASVACWQSPGTGVWRKPRTWATQTITRIATKAWEGQARRQGPFRASKLSSFETSLEVLWQEMVAVLSVVDTVALEVGRSPTGLIQKRTLSCFSSSRFTLLQYM